MAVEIEFLPWLGERLGGAAYRSAHLIWEVEPSPGESVGALFSRLAAASDAFRDAVFDPGPACLRPSIVVVLNDRLLDLVGGLEAVPGEGDRLVVVAALAGG